MFSKGNYIYSRISEGWKSKYPKKQIEKIGCTKWIEYRKWWGSTERLYPSEYKWYIDIKDLGRFPSVVSAEQTIFQHPFFTCRNVKNGTGSGDEFFEFFLHDDSLRKTCEILVQYDVVFKVVEGDPFPIKPRSIPIEEEKIVYVQPLQPITNIETPEIKLREYQQDCIHKMSLVIIGIIIAATGIGKTVIMCMYMSRIQGKYLIVVPSQKLVDQTVETCEKFLGKSFIVSRYDKHTIKEVIKGKNVVIIGTYQNSHKLQKIPEIDCILFDECHSTVILNPPKDKEGKRILSRFQQLLKYPCERKFFFTATEKNIQADGKVISMDNKEIYGPVVFRYGLEQAIKDGWLSDYRFILVATKNRIKSCIKYINSGYKTVIFCGKQETVENVYKKLHNELHKSIKLYKLGHDDDVNTNTRLFSKYEGQAVFVVCRKITMGYDEPQIDTVIHYDLTTSSIMTHQRNGRAFRLHKDKVMATLVFLCDISGNEEERKEKIRQLHHPIIHLKEMDKRFEGRVKKEILKSIDEFSTIDIIVDGDFDIIESKEVYDRCWKMIDEKRDILKDEFQKCIIHNREKNILSKSMYRHIVENTDGMISHPERYFSRLWTNWYDFLGINTDSFVKTKDEWKRRCIELNINSWSCYKKLQSDHPELPLMPEEIYYNFSNFDNEIGMKPSLILLR